MRLSSQICLIQKPGQPSPLGRVTAGGQGSCSSLERHSYTPASKTTGQNYLLGNWGPESGADLPQATTTMGPKAPDSAVTASPPTPITCPGALGSIEGPAQTNPPFPPSTALPGVTTPLRMTSRPPEFYRTSHPHLHISEGRDNGWMRDGHYPQGTHSRQEVTKGLLARPKAGPRRGFPRKTQPTVGEKMQGWEDGGSVPTCLSLVPQPVL